MSGQEALEKAPKSFSAQPTQTRGAYAHLAHDTRFRVHFLDGEHDEAAVASMAVAAQRLGSRGISGARIEIGDIPEVDLIEYDTGADGKLGFSSHSKFEEVGESLGYKRITYGRVWNIFRNNNYLALKLIDLRQFMVEGKEALAELEDNDSGWADRKREELGKDYKQHQWYARYQPHGEDLENDPTITIHNWQRPYLFVTESRKRPTSAYGKPKKVGETFIDMDALYKLEAHGKTGDYTKHTGVVCQNIINSFINLHIIDHINDSDSLMH